MHIFVTSPTGKTVRLEAMEGYRVMEIIRDWAEDTGIGVRAECGGACACATCHVYVDETWVDRLHPMLDEEEERLDEAFNVEPNSRLSCQLLMSQELDGLSVSLAQDAYLEVSKPKAA